MRWWGAGRGCRALFPQCALCPNKATRESSRARIPPPITCQEVKWEKRLASPELLESCSLDLSEEALHFSDQTLKKLLESGAHLGMLGVFTHVVGR